MNNSDKYHLINKREINEELKYSFLSYSMSVITSRAIPQLSDGLKPIHRRIIYAMFRSQMLPSRPTKKCAKIIGETIAKYHPHGDTSVYDALVRMGQWFRIRYPIIIPQGNFGSIDGDNPAAMRYTEAKLSKYAMTLLQDIEFNTINYQINYDNSEKEPSFLPSRLPNVLLNGSDGIAVGMATKIPPHNLNEVVDATVFLIKNKNASFKNIFEFIKGPDFPTGGLIVNNGAIEKFYKTGKGSFLIESKWNVEEAKSGNRKKIIVTEIPYYVSKSALICQISDFITKKKVNEIYDVCDESSRKGMRIVIELKNQYVQEKKIIFLLNKNTQLRSYFHGNFVALIDKRPVEGINIMFALNSYIKYQEKLLLKKYKYLLGETLYQTELLNSLIKAVENIDLVIKIIKTASSKQEIIDQLKMSLSVNTNQAQRILNLKLHRLSNLEHTNLKLKISNNYEAINRYQKIILNKNSIDEQLVTDLQNLKTLHGDKRKSIIIPYESVNEKEVVEVQKCLLVLTKKNYIKLVLLNEFNLQKRGGKGVTNKNLYEKDNIKFIHYCLNNEKLFLFSDKGRVYRIMAYKIPIENRHAKGVYLYNLIPNLEKNKEKIVTIINISKTFIYEYLFFLTIKNKIKKIAIKHFLNITRGGKKAINLKKNDDLLVGVINVGEDDDFVIASSEGRLVRSQISKLRTFSGGNGIGVSVMTKKQHPISISSSKAGNLVLSISRRGYGKLTKITQHRACGKNSCGSRVMKINQKTGPLFTAICVNYFENILINTVRNKNILININNISILSRNTSGVKLICMAENDYIKSIAVISIGEQKQLKYPLCTI